MNMTSDRFQQCLAAIGWSTLGCSKRLGVTESRVRRWVAGQYPVPDEIGRWVERIAKVHEQNPPPQIA